MNTARAIIAKSVIALLLSFTMISVLVGYLSFRSVNSVTIKDGIQTRQISTYCNTADEILSDAGIKLLCGDQVDFNLKNGIGILNINRAFPVYITNGNDTVSISMTQGTVADALEKAGIKLDEYDICNKDLDEVLTEESYIDVVSVEYTTVSYEETIPYTTKVEYSSRLNNGEKKTTGGENGSKVVTLKQRIENGVVTDSEVVSETVTKNAVEKTTVIGTKKAATQKNTASKSQNQTAVQKKTVKTISVLGSVSVDANGAPLSYKKLMTFKASAYTAPSGAKCSTGVAVKPGYIAVNPNIIPYGTKMYITSKDGKYIYGYAIAADTGGFAKRNPYMVDLFFNTKSECTAFGIRNVNIYILD